MRATAGYMPRQRPERAWSSWGAQPQPQCVLAACGCSMRAAHKCIATGREIATVARILAWLEKPRFRRNLVKMASCIHVLGRKKFRAPAGTDASYISKKPKKNPFEPEKNPFRHLPSYHARVLVFTTSDLRLISLVLEYSTYKVPRCGSYNS